MPVTMEEVAAKAGVSRSLVSLVMRGSRHVSERSRYMVQAAAAELGYQPNLIARQLASVRTATIGVLLSDLQNPLFAETLDRLDIEARKRGYRLLIGTGLRRRQREREAVESFLGYRVDGVMLVGTILSASTIRAVAERVPLVLLGPVVPGVDVIDTDHQVGARLAVEHLIGLGHRRIAHIDGGRGVGAALRRSTYVAVMREHGIDHEVQVAHGNYSEESGESGARQLLGHHRHPTAIFAANDLCAIGVLHIAHEKGLSVPADLSVVGFDDSVLARAGYISLTTVAHHPRNKVAAAAVNLLLGRIDGQSNGPRHLLFSPSLVVRHSTAPPPTRSPAPVMARA